MAYQFQPGANVVADGDSITAGSASGGVPYYQPFLDQVDTAYFVAGVTVTTAKATATTALASASTSPSLAPKDYRPVVTNTGVGGSKIADLLSRVAAVVALHPTDVWVEVGVNDANNGTNIGTFRANFDSYLAALNAGTPVPRIIVSNIFSLDEQFPDSLGAAVNTYNAQIVASAAGAGAVLIDVRTDQQAWEQANNTPPPGASSGLLTNDGIHPQPGANRGIVLWSTTLRNNTTFNGTP